MLKAAGSVDGHLLPQAPQFFTSLSMRVSQPSASEPTAVAGPSSQFRKGGLHWNVQVLFAQPTSVFAFASQAVWQDPQCCGVCSETQVKLSGRPSGPGQHAGVAPEHGPVVPPQEHVPTHRLVDVRGQVSSQPGPQWVASASYGGWPGAAVQAPSFPFRQTRVPATHIVASETPQGLASPSEHETPSLNVSCAREGPLVTWTTKSTDGETTSSGLPA
ncbi:MAG TPA: hypothetical protein VFE93_18035, partial [Myxococcaceae bacterium]|nr:hypothetical protein [Myxococcaceae bacterium]